MTRGRLAAIYVTGAAAAPMCAVESVRATCGRGLDGDRYALGIGHYSDRGGPGREVTLIAREAVAAVNAEGVVLDESESRRNLVTEGVRLDGLMGRRFRVGNVVLIGRRPCPPCAYLAGLTRPGVFRALADRGGLRADIVTGGVLHVGDAIEVAEVEAAFADMGG